MTNPNAESAKSKRIQIENLAPSITEAQLRGLFLAHGHVISYDRPLDVATGRPGLMAYLEMAPDEADAAVKALNGHEISGIALILSAMPVGTWTPDADRHARAPEPRRTVLAPSKPVAPTA